MVAWFKSRQGTPEPAGEAEVVRAFGTDEPTLSREGVTVDGGHWQVVAGEGQTVRLFEFVVPGLEQCLLTYRASLTSEGLTGKAYLEMWCRIPGRGEFFSRGLAQPLTGTTSWAAFETPFVLKKGQRADLVKLNVVVAGAGTIGIKDVQLLAAPLV